MYESRLVIYKFFARLSHVDDEDRVLRDHVLGKRGGGACLEAILSLTTVTLHGAIAQDICIRKTEPHGKFAVQVVVIEGCFN